MTIDLGELVSCADLARRWELSKQRVHQLTAIDDFPEPAVHIDGGRRALYRADQCERWRAARPDGPGRPRKQAA